VKLLLLACAAPSHDTSPSDGQAPDTEDASHDTAPVDTAVPDPCETMLAWWEAAGEVTDLSEAVSAGSEEAALQLTLVEPGTLSFCAGTWFVYVRAQADVVVRGVAGAESTTLDAERAGPVIEVEGEHAVEVSSLTLTGGRSQHGGGVWARLGAQVTVRDAEIEHNEVEVDGHGGGLCASDGSSVTVDGVVFRGNRAAEGGGVAIMDSTAALTDVAFHDNEVSGDVLPGYGGGLFVEGGAVTVDGGHFQLNTAQTAGGAVAGWNGAALTLSGVTTQANSTGSKGGDVYLLFAEATIYDSVLTDGSAAEAGGGIAAKYSTLTLVDSEIVSTASERGAGIDLYASTATLSGTQLTANDAQVEGGGVYLDVDSALAATQVVFDGNAPEDVFVEGVGAYATGGDGSFSCDGSGCVGGR